MLWITIAVVVALYLAFEALVYCFKDDDCDPYGSITEKPSRESTDDQPKFYKN